MDALSLISLGLSLTGSILVNRGVIGQNTDNLVNGIYSTVNSLVTALKNKQNPQDPYLAMLAALSGITTVLQSTTGLPKDILDNINAIDKDVQAAINGFVTAGRGLDLTLYAPIAEV